MTIELKVFDDRNEYIHLRFEDIWSLGVALESLIIVEKTLINDAKIFE